MTVIFFMQGIFQTLTTNELHFCIDDTSCAPEFWCGKHNENPNYGYTNFDNFYWSIINVKIFKIRFIKLQLMIIGNIFRIIFN